MKDYVYLGTMVETRDYTNGRPKFEVHNLLTLDTVHLQSARGNSNFQEPELGAKVRLVFTSEFS